MRTISQAMTDLSVKNYITFEVSKEVKIISPNYNERVRIMDISYAGSIWGKSKECTGIQGPHV
jgi:hypothetical protein